MIRWTEWLAQGGRRKKMGSGRTAALLALLSWLVLTPALSESEKAVGSPRIYADREGRFSFRLSGDWIKLRADSEKGIAGSFLLTSDVGGDRKVVAELVISLAGLKSPVGLEDYVKGEDRRAMSTPGFKRIGGQERCVLGGSPALRNRYSYTQGTGPAELRQKVVYQYFALAEKTIWGITLTALREDEPILEAVEREVASSFQFSVPEGLRAGAADVFKKVTVGGTLGGFSLSVPASWKVDLSDEQGASIRGPEAIVHAFAVPAEEEQGSLQDVAGRFLRERENLKELRVLSQGGIEVGLVQGYAVEYSGAAKGRQWHVRLITFAKDARVFFLHCVAPEEEWWRSSEVIGQIERSVSAGTPAPMIEGGT